MTDTTNVGSGQGGPGADGVDEETGLDWGTLAMLAGLADGVGTLSPPGETEQDDEGGVDDGGERRYEPWAPHPPVRGTVTAPTNPLPLARELVQRWTSHGLPTLIEWRDTWLRWTGTHWVETDQDDLVANLYEVTEHAQFAQGGAQDGVDLRPWAPNPKRVSDLLNTIRSVVHVSTEVELPSWVGEAPRVEGQLIACQNGVLDTGCRRLLPHTPAYLNRVAVPFAYDAGAAEPVRWQGFLRSVWPDDREAIRTLQEWLGYVLSGRTDLQKMLLIVGPPRSGKGTIARVVASLVGRANVAGPTFASLGTNFGLSSLIGKTVAMISDARMPRKDTEVITERLLSITGEDTLDVDRKNRDIWTGRLAARIMVMSNELPTFPDASSAVTNRFLTLTMRESFLGREDVELENDLLAELPSILNWALVGLDRLTVRGRFGRGPSSSDTAVDMMTESASPVSVFIDDCCEVGVDLSVNARDLFETWRTWCVGEGRHPGSSAQFGKNVKAVVPGLEKPRVTVDGQRVNLYTGIALKPGVTWVP